MKDIINNLQKYHAWKIQLTTAINFISFKDTDEEHVMNSKSDNVEIMILNYFFNKSQNGLETSIKGSIVLICCICCITDVIKYIKATNWIKNKRETISSNNDYDR